MGAPDAVLAAPPSEALPSWLALVAPLFCAAAGESKENEAPQEPAAAPSGKRPQAEAPPPSDVPWWRPLFWSPTTGTEAHEALQDALPLIGCVFRALCALATRPGAMGRMKPGLRLCELAARPRGALSALSRRPRARF